MYPGLIRYKDGRREIVWADDPVQLIDKVYSATYPWKDTAYRIVHGHYSVRGMATERFPVPRILWEEPYP